MTAEPAEQTWTHSLRAGARSFANVGMSFHKFKFTDISGQDSPDPGHLPTGVRMALTSWLRPSEITIAADANRRSGVLAPVAES
jgi:hypothetical protein